MIWGFLGPEGSGKSLAMTYFCLQHIKRGGVVRTFPGYAIHDLNGKPLSTEIDVEEWATMPDNLRNTIIAIDEIQNYLDAYRYNTLLSRIFGYVGMQRRKLNLGMLYTLQNWVWVNNRVRWLTHLCTYCKDLSWTEWGKEEGIKRGKMMQLTTFDMKGFYTGQEGALYSQKTLQGEGIWNYYNSYMPQDIFQGFTKLQIKPRNVVVDLNPGSGEDDAEEQAATEEAKANQQNKQAVKQGLLQKLMEQGVDPKTLSLVARGL